MKLTNIFVFVTLTVIVKGTWWVVAVQPFILSIGAILGAIDQDVINIEELF